MEHIVPESLGNTRILLFDQICDACQSYLGKQIEEYVLRRSPIGAWRVLAGIKTKHGKLPTFSFRQPSTDKGRLPDRHVENDDSVTLSYSGDAEREYDIDDKELLENIADGTKKDFRLVLTPKMLHMMGRFLGKIGLEMIARDYPEKARDTAFDQMRKFVRFGQPVSFLWPIFHGVAEEPIADCPCEVAVLDSNAKPGNAYTLSILTLGHECWVTCLNDPYPTPDIRKSFPGFELEALLY